MGYRKAARMRRTQFVRGHYRNGHYVSAHVRNDMGPTPQWVWNIFIGFGSLVGLIVFFSVASYEMDRNPGLQAQPRDTSTRQMNRRGR